MALITCPDCGKEFSDQAAACPNCGRPNIPVSRDAIQMHSAGNARIDLGKAPVRSGTQAAPKRKKNSSLSVIAFIFSLLGCTFVLGFLLAIIDLCKKDKEHDHILSIFSIGISVAWIFLIAASASLGDESNTGNSTAQIEETTIDSSDVEELESSEETEMIVYIPVTADELADALNGNAMKAKEDYEGKYLEITGTLGTVDSDGKYIGIDTDAFALVNIQCYLQTDDQRAVVMSKTTGDSIVVRGICEDVGELLGYRIEIDSIE